MHVGFARVIWAEYIAAILLLSAPSLQSAQVRVEEDLSRKGAKAQSATAFLRGFLCGFAPLREKYFFPTGGQMKFEL